MSVSTLRSGVYLYVLLFCGILHAQVTVPTYQYDNSRSGTNPNETVLTPANVNVNQFGRKAVFSVQGFVYAQPSPNTIRPMHSISTWASSCGTPTC